MAEDVLYNVGQIARCRAFTLERKDEMSKQWEYNVVDVPYLIKNNRTLLDNLGADGWELVSVSDDLAYMKREKKAAEPQEPAFPVISDPWAAKAVLTLAQVEAVQ